MANALQNTLHRLSFGLKQRAEVWQTLADFTATGMELSVALDTVARIYRLQKNSSIEHIMQEFRRGLATGSILPAARTYASETDLLMFSGEGDMAADAMFGAAARVSRGQLVIRQAVRAALIGPSLSILALFALYCILGFRLFPAFELIAPPETWPPHVKALAWFAYGISENIILVGGGAAAVLAGISASTRHWTGAGRAWADKFPPWSLYRLQTGLTFMLLLVEAGKMGRGLTSSWLLETARVSAPYTAARIRAIAARSGANPAGIGAAALSSGRGWPTTALCATLAAYSTQDNWLNNFSDYLDRWMENAQARAKATATVMNFMVLVVVAATVGATVTAMMSLMDAAQAGY